MLNRYDTPPIETTVRPEDDNERALETYQEFEDSDLFGIFDQDQLAAYSALKKETEKFAQLAAGGAQGMPNISGTQMPGEGGLPALGPEAGVPDANAPEGGPLGSPVGEPNGPVQ